MPRPGDNGAALAAAGFAAVPDRDKFDYVYAARDIALLAGGRFDGKRNHIRRLTQAHAGQKREPAAASLRAFVLLPA